MHRSSFLIIREMPLNTECRLIDYSRYAANTHSIRASTHAFDFMIMVTLTQDRGRAPIVFPFDSSFAVINFDPGPSFH